MACDVVFLGEEGDEGEIARGLGEDEMAIENAVCGVCEGGGGECECGECVGGEMDSDGEDELEWEGLQGHLGRNDDDDDDGDDSGPL